MFNRRVTEIHFKGTMAHLTPEWEICQTLLFSLNELGEKPFNILKCFLIFLKNVFSPRVSIVVRTKNEQRSSKKS